MKKGFLSIPLLFLVLIPLLIVAVSFFQLIKRETQVKKDYGNTEPYTQKDYPTVLVRTKDYLKLGEHDWANIFEINLNNGTFIPTNAMHPYFAARNETDHENKVRNDINFEVLFKNAGLVDENTYVSRTLWRDDIALVSLSNTTTQYIGQFDLETNESSILYTRTKPGRGYCEDYELLDVELATKNFLFFELMDSTVDSSSCDLKSVIIYDYANKQDVKRITLSSFGNLVYTSGFGLFDYGHLLLATSDSTGKSNKHMIINLETEENILLDGEVLSHNSINPLHYLEGDILPVRLYTASNSEVVYRLFDMQTKTYSKDIEFDTTRSDTGKLLSYTLPVLFEPKAPLIFFKTVSSPIKVDCLYKVSSENTPEKVICADEIYAKYLPSPNTSKYSGFEVLSVYEASK